jgi:catechol 2,3-dioxygenase-like lactoylglutathione lyase family enzyme
MPGRGIQHVDLAVTDLDLSLAFYLDVLGPLGLKEEERYPTYRGTEDVVYLSFGDEWLGLRPSDGGTFQYYGPGIEHLAFEVDTSDEVDAAHERCTQRGLLRLLRLRPGRLSHRGLRCRGGVVRADPPFVRDLVDRPVPNACLCG